MSALGHYIEEEGIATVAISLIRPQTENTKPPRALWVPFELGRPFGPPSDPAFQKQVLLSALRMLARDDGPVVIDDFPDDDPRAQPDSTWSPPRLPQPPAGATGEALASMLEAEIALLQGARQHWSARYDRSAVGLTGLPIADSGRYLGEWLRGRALQSPRDGFSAPLMLRFAVDDLKAHHLEAGGASPARPSSRQLGDWFWNHTAGGAAIHALREMCLASDDERLKLIGGNFLVPALRVRSSS